VFFSALESRLALHALILNVLLAITMPVTTLLLARAALFRKRQAGEAVPPALGNGTRS
jgi:multicomponent K+:H+ antiporter subunit G